MFGLTNDDAVAAMAVYAAIVSTAALTLELVSQWRTWATRVEVKMRRMTIASPTGSYPAVVFTIINHSGHAVKVTHLGMEPIKKGGPSLFFPQPLPLGIPGPFEIPPRDAITLHQTPESLGEGDPEHKTRAVVSTSDGKTFKSRKARLRELVRD